MDLLKQFPTFKSGLVAFFFAAIGGVTGALTQQYFGVKLEEEKKLLDLRKEAYASFFKGQTALQLLGDPQLSDQKRAEAQSDYANSVNNGRFLIAIYSTKPVVEALSDLVEEIHPISTCDGTPERWRRELKTYQSMRRELFGRDWLTTIGVSSSQDVDEDKLMIVMFDCRPPK